MKNIIENESESDSIENLLFSGLIYRIISEPDGLRTLMGGRDIFIDSTQSVDVATKLTKIQSAMKTVDRIKDKDGAFSAFEAFIEDSRYGLIILDQQYHHIFHNHKAVDILEQLFGQNSPRKLKQQYIKKLQQAKQNLNHNSSRLITIPNVIDDKINAYLISNKHSFDNDRHFNILLIPNLEDNKFELHKELVAKYGFTNKETLVLSNLIAGCNLQKISEQFCISLNTVRSHLKSIFRKTETKSQTDLIRLFLKHDSQFLESYLEPIRQVEALDSQDTSTDLFVTLSAGNTICYRDYGPKDGRPLVIFHNLLGSRFNIPYKYSEILSCTNRRIIIPERPGYGLSDVVSNPTTQWHDMFNEFIDRLEISSFDLLGNIHGSAIAVSYAATSPASLQSMILTSPVFFNHIEQNELLSEINYSASRMVYVSKPMAINTFRLWVKSMKFDTERYIRRMLKLYAGANELHVLDDQNYIDRLVLNFTESQRHDSNGSAQDSAYCLTPLELDLANIKIPINIWIGDEDSLISVNSAKQICASLPNKTFHLRKGYGEEIFYHLFEEIIQ